MKPIRILLVRNCRGITGITGGETYLLSLLKGFDPQQCTCMLACIVNPDLGETPWLRELKASGFDYVTIPVRNPFNFKDICAVTSLIKQYDADVVHALDHRSDLISVISARLTGRPVVASFLGWVNFAKGSWRAALYPRIDRMILKRFDAVITDSVAIGTELHMTPDDPPVVAIRNGIDTNWFDPARALTPFSGQQFTAGGHFVFGMVGRIHPVKGHVNFLKAARTILDTHPDCRFLIVGTVLPGCEAYKQELLEFIHHHHLEQSVLMAHVPSAEIPAVFAGMDVLVAPSFAESFSFTLLEGMAMEKTVVSSDVGGANEMITDGETGYLIPVGDLSRLTDTLLMLRAAPDKVKEVGQRARHKIIRDMGIKMMAARTHEVYRKLIDFKAHGTDSRRHKRQLRERLAMISAK